MNQQFVSPEVEKVSELYDLDWFKEIRDFPHTRSDNRLDRSISNVLASNVVDFELRPTDVFVSISKTFTFAAAHFLPNHKGKCRNLHGHEWKFRVCVSAPVNNEGMVMDYSDLKTIVNVVVINTLDHAYLNKLVNNPTAENLVVYIWQMLQYSGGLKGISSITLWESPDSMCKITAAQMERVMQNILTKVALS